MSLEQIKRRIKRSSIIIASIALGIALMSHFLVANLIFQSYGQVTGMVMEAYQFWLIAVSFIVCVVDLTNSSLIAVYERYREIGIMKSLGALDRHVLELFEELHRIGDGFVHRLEVRHGLPHRLIIVTSSNSDKPA